jgi:hypothetical protein
MGKTNYLWLVPLPLGAGFIAGGGYMVVQGLLAKRQVREALEAEQIVSSTESRIPGVLVNSAATAEAQEEVIRTHSLRETGGRTFAQLPRGDALRDYYLRAVTLRTALGLAVMGFKISDLVIGLGAFGAAVGVGMIAISAALRRSGDADNAQ